MFSYYGERLHEYFQAVVENHEVDSNIGNMLKCFLE